MENLVEILKGHEGTTLYSPLIGEVILTEIDDDEETYPITVIGTEMESYSFTAEGRFISTTDGECMLFPAKDQRDWSKWNQKKFRVTFGDTSELYTTKELKNFINVAVIHNKDVSKFSVERIKE